MSRSTINPFDWSSIQPRVDALLEVELNHDTVEQWLHEWSELTAILEEAGAQVYRDVMENTSDREAERRFRVMVEEIVPKAQVADQTLKEKLLAFEAYRPTTSTEQLLKRFRTEVAIFRNENVPLLSQLMILGNEYDRKIGNMTIDWEGESRTIPQIELYLQEQERDVRERAWHLIMERYLAERESLNELYLSMLRLRRQVASNAGFANFREYQWQALGRFDYSPEDCFAFHNAIEHEVVPLARRLHDRLRERLGLERLRPWDTRVDPYGKPLLPFKHAHELEAGVSRIFKQVDGKLSEHYETIRGDFMDLASRPNKAPGGYCHAFPVSGKAYIFMNAVGNHQDVSTLLHEGGHAFHFMEAKALPLVWNYNPPMEFCEVASMAMELLSAPYLEKEKGGFYNHADARRAYSEQLRNIIFFLPYMVIVDAFQHWVYVDAPADVTPGDMDAKWSNLWDRFMPVIDYSGLQTEKETGWHRKIHIFTDPFYYIEYGLAQLGALQIWRNALQDQAKAVADYRKALALGATRPLPELFKTAGAVFAFDRTTVGELVSLIEEQMTRLKSDPL